jgi:hypothetical protein
MRDLGPNSMTIFHARQMLYAGTAQVRRLCDRSRLVYICMFEDGCFSEIYTKREVIGRENDPGNDRKFAER